MPIVDSWNGREIALFESSTAATLSVMRAGQARTGGFIDRTRLQRQDRRPVVNCAYGYQEEDQKEAREVEEGIAEKESNQEAG